MAAGRLVEAEDYLRENKIIDLVNNLTGLLLYHRPERPREFLISQLEKLKLARLADLDYPCLFDESNVEAVFGILDPAGQGYITGTQYTEGKKQGTIQLMSKPNLYIMTSFIIRTLYVKEDVKCKFSFEAQQDH
ncbi:PREDICTED: EF-hand calcium-binding domain-containing protein 10-like [Nanorana parkeri]|uniref:EF-hand calcium-binding domain-containing protein 10-like n=1 Tax=Nanorana parkeri TaxID=125878 RepID=UPI000855001A|nr:PREDICTED: EF-hand calcium-binding domain-containing protein 10-like [Nanorana parkeri]